MLVDDLQQDTDGLRWSAPESWHVTLQFLGNVSASQNDCLLNALRPVRRAPVSIRLGELGFFERVGIFHVAIDLNAELEALQREVTAATQPCGFEPEERAYRPHITLARNRGRTNAIRALKHRIRTAPQFTTFTAREFLLYESFLQPGGSRYEVRQRFPFAL